MRKYWGLLVLALILILGLALLSGCSTQSAGSAGEGDSGNGEEENGDLDEIDLSMGCPEEPTIFFLHLDYQMNVEEDDGYIHERTDPSVGVPISIHGSQVADLEPSTTLGERIPVTIEGASGDCTIDGMAQIELAIVRGSCELGVATLDIEGTYEIYQRTIHCPGEAPIQFTDSLFPGPSITADFNLSEAGDTFDWSQDMGEVEFVYKWTLKFGYPYLEVQ